MIQDFAFLSEEINDFYWPRTIRRIRMPTPLEFYRDYVSMNKPVIIVDGFHWDALEKWNHAYLKETMQGVAVSVDITPDGHGDCIVDGKFVQPQQVTMDFDQYIDYVDGHEDAIGTYYIQKQNDSFRLEYLGTQVEKDIEEDVLAWGSEVFGAPPDAINFWMGDDKAVSSMHHDPYENLYCVVKGQKTFTLLPPTDFPYISKTPYPSGRYEYRDGEWGIVMDDPPGEVMWIPVDPDNIDLDKYPKMIHASPLKVEVKKGEILYLPSMVYHKVSQQGDEEGTTIAINYWFDMSFDIKFCYFKFLERLALQYNATENTSTI
eukprot:TRINITY_DN3524_c0_g1_i1.p1 TRINITY_DN3524_c0_g1~~TRINITY_DN3524_c0_g1_i1.p1  ORF type:complete len:334 (-),score=66.74 TRINITY_DN3524_c0_g1_i1:15-971(-)